MHLNLTWSCQMLTDYGCKMALSSIYGYFNEEENNWRTSSSWINRQGVGQQRRTTCNTAGNHPTVFTWANVSHPSKFYSRWEESMGRVSQSRPKISRILRESLFFYPRLHRRRIHPLPPPPDQGTDLLDYSFTGTVRNIPWCISDEPFHISSMIVQQWGLLKLSLDTSHPSGQFWPLGEWTTTMKVVILTHNALCLSSPFERFKQKLYADVVPRSLSDRFRTRWKFPFLDSQI